MDTVPIKPDLIGEDEAALLLTVSVRTLQSWRICGKGPVFIKLGRAVRYRQKDILQWLDDCASRRAKAQICVGAN